MNPDEIDPKAALAGLSDARMAEAKQAVRAQFDQLVGQGLVNDDNYCAYAEQVVDEIVYDRGLQLGNEEVVIVAWNTVFADLLDYAQRRYPSSTAD